MAHDLRREAGSRLLEGGLREHAVQKLLDRARTVAGEVDAALTFTESPTEPQATEIPIAEALTGQPLTN